MAVKHRFPEKNTKMTSPEITVDISHADDANGVYQEVASEKELRRFRMEEFYQLTHILFTKPERLILYKIMKDYQRRRDIDRLVVGLKLLLRTYTKLEVLKYIRYFLWHGHIKEFDRQTQFHKHFRPRQKNGDSLLHPPEHASVVSASTSTSSKKYKDVRVFTIQRDVGQQSLGFSVRGGSEHGLGIYISDIDPESTAERSGLEVGDKILEANNISLKGVASSSAVRVLTGSHRLKLVIQRTRKVPEWRLSREKTSWYDVHEKRLISGEFEECGISHNIRGLEDGTPERRINLTFSKTDRTLGFNIRGGREYGLGIYVSKLDRGGLADKNGVRVGDQVIDVNGIPFDNITHAHAVEVLKGKRHLILTLRDVGRFPVYKELYAEYTWSDGQLKSATSLTSLREGRQGRESHEATRLKAPSVSDLFSNRRKPSALQSEIFLPKSRTEDIHLSGHYDNDDSDSLINLDQWARDIRSDSDRERNNYGYVSDEAHEVVIHVHNVSDDAHGDNERANNPRGVVSDNDRREVGQLDEDEGDYAVVDTIYAKIEKKAELSKPAVASNDSLRRNGLYSSNWSNKESDDGNVYTTRYGDEAYLSTQSLDRGHLSIASPDRLSPSSVSLQSEAGSDLAVPKVEGALYSQIRRKSHGGSFSNLSQSFSELTTIKREEILTAGSSHDSHENVKFDVVTGQTIISNTIPGDEDASDDSDFSDDDRKNASNSDDARSRASTSRSYDLASQTKTKGRIKRYSKKSSKREDTLQTSISSGVYSMTPSNSSRQDERDANDMNDVTDGGSLEIRLQELQERQTVIGLQELNSLSPDGSDDIGTGSTRKKGKFKTIKDKIKASLRIKKSKRPELQVKDIDLSPTRRKGGSVKNVIDGYNLATFEDSAREMLTPPEYEAVMRYVRSYHENHDLQKLVEMLLCLLDKPEKLMLLKDIRGVIYPLEVTRFDTMVNKYEIEAYQKLSLKLHLPLNHKHQRKPRKTLMTTEIAEDGHFHIRSMEQTAKQREVVGVFQEIAAGRHGNPTSPKRQDTREAEEDHAAISHFEFLDHAQSDITNNFGIRSDDEHGELERIPGSVVVHLSKMKPSLGLDFIEEEVCGVREVKIARIDPAGAANDDSVIEVGMTLLAVDRHHVDGCPLSEVLAVLQRSYMDKHYVTMKLVFHRQESTQF